MTEESNLTIAVESLPQALELAKRYLELLYHQKVVDATAKLWAAREKAVAERELSKLTNMGILESLKTFIKQYPTKGKRTLSVPLDDDQGEVALRVKQCKDAKLRITDSTAALQWAEQHAPEMVSEKEVKRTIRELDVEAFAQYCAQNRNLNLPFISIEPAGAEHLEAVGLEKLIREKKDRIAVSLSKLRSPRELEMEE